jgi:voltage-gated potassium channel
MARGFSGQVSDLPKRMEIFGFLLVFLLLFGAIGFKFLENLTFTEAIIRTLQTMAFMFEAESGLAKGLEVFLALYGVFLVWWVLWGISDMFLDGRVSEYLKIQKYFSRLKKMANHYVIAGGGRVGEEIAKSLAKDNKDVVIIEKDPAKAEKLRKKNFLVIDGDITDAETDVILKANLKSAEALILALPETEKNLLITLMVKEIHPNVSIYVRADNAAYVNRLKKAGARAVIVPEITAAERFLQEIKAS